MRIRLIFATFLVCAAAQASSTLRVGSQVLTAGDSAARVTALLGKPAYKSHSGRSTKRGHRGSRYNPGGDRAERWQYRRHGTVTTVTLVDGRVIEIEESRI